MNNLLKTGFGIFFALFMGLQGIVLQHIQEESDSGNFQTQETYELGKVFIGDYTKSLPIIVEQEKLTQAQQIHFYFPSLDFVASYYAQLIYFENLIKKKISQSSLVDLTFDIRDLKFPSHFFW